MHGTAKYRYLVASRNIVAGEVIFRDEPLFVGPNADILPQCINCCAKVIIEHRRTVLCISNNFHLIA